jgi:hypothetical protein
MIQIPYHTLCNKLLTDGPHKFSVSHCCWVNALVNCNAVFIKSGTENFSSVTVNLSEPFRQVSCLIPSALNAFVAM